MSTTSLPLATTPDALRARLSPVAPTTAVAPATTLRIRPTGPVVALRAGKVVALGGLVDRIMLADDHVVSARTPANEPRWVPASAVWRDAVDGTADHPVSVGLATGTTLPQVLVSGLSDRLGWEALQALEGGLDLPVATEAGAAPRRPGTMLVLDGRLGHDIPTVVVLGRDFVRWGAAATWDGAVRRAMYDTRDGERDFGVEFEMMSRLLGRAGLGAVTVDLGSPALTQAGLLRASVQLVRAHR